MSAHGSLTLAQDGLQIAYLKSQVGNVSRTFFCLTDPKKSFFKSSTHWSIAAEPEVISPVVTAFSIAGRIAEELEDEATVCP